MRAIRVAQAKIDPTRRAASRRDGAKPGEPLHITEFSARHRRDLLAAAPHLARRCSRCGEARLTFQRGMQVNSQSISGFLRLWLIAKLRPRAQDLPLRGGAARDRGLARLDCRGAHQSADLALEITECARLIKGYGDTHKRGVANYR